MKNNPLTTSTRPVWTRFAFIFVIVLVLLQLALWLVAGEATIVSLLRGDGPAFVTSMLVYHQSLDPDVRNALFYKELVQAALIRLNVLLLLAASFLWIAWPALKLRWQGFMSEPVRPQTLAVFRMVCFGTLLYYPDYDVIISMSALPNGLLVPPPGWQWVLAHFSPNTALLTWLIPTYQLAALAALVGFRTRWTALLTLIFGLWILGIPQFYGKINHYHHLLWFAGIAAFAPASQVWSVDSWYKKVAFDPKQHRYYLALILLSMVVIYFFAGWWKVLGGGFMWIWGDAARLQMEAQLLRLSKDLPLWWPTSPVFFKMSGLLTILFELSWGWWMLSRKSRPWALLAGMAFHITIYIVMDINFWVLPVFYVIFLPFQRWFPEHAVESSGSWVLTKWHWTRLYMALIVLFGFAHLDSWPLAVYPSFGNPPETKVWQVYLDYEEGQNTQRVSLVGDVVLRQWLPKTRLMGLHGQLTGKEEMAVEKIKLLDPFYCEALGIAPKQNRRYVKRKIDLQTGEVLEIRLLWQVSELVE
jgi:hypothetical protein